MLNKLRKEQGFTLIELLIVVAIIGILAAIAIPQFTSYRQKGFNAAANADIKNAKLAQEALFADHQTYGVSANVQNLAGVADPGVAGAAGVLLVGPLAAATSQVNIAGSGALCGPRNSDGKGVGVGTGISNGVSLYATNLAAPGAPNFGSQSYIMVSKHTQGTREYYAEQPSTAIWYVQNGQWAGMPLIVATGAPATGVPAAAALAPQMTAATGGSGEAPVTTWTAL